MGGEGGAGGGKGGRGGKGGEGGRGSIVSASVIHSPVISVSFFFSSPFRSCCSINKLFPVRLFTFPPPFREISKKSLVDSEYIDRLGFISYPNEILTS